MVWNKVYDVKPQWASLPSHSQNTDCLQFSMQVLISFTWALFGIFPVAAQYHLLPHKLADVHREGQARGALFHSFEDLKTEEEMSEATQFKYNRCFMTNKTLLFFLN